MLIEPRMTRVESRPCISIKPRPVTHGHLVASQEPVGYAVARGAKVGLRRAPKTPHVRAGAAARANVRARSNRANVGGRARSGRVCGERTSPEPRAECPGGRCRPAGRLDPNG